MFIGILHLHKQTKPELNIFWSFRVSISWLLVFIHSSIKNTKILWLMPHFIFWKFKWRSPLIFVVWMSGLRPFIFIFTFLIRKILGLPPVLYFFKFIWRCFDIFVIMMSGLRPSIFIFALLITKILGLTPRFYFLSKNRGALTLIFS